MENATVNCVDATGGEHLNIAGGAYRILVDGAQTNEQYAVIEMVVPPGAGPRLHAHKDIHETFYVAEGAVTFYANNEKIQATQGSFVSIPLGGIIHAFKNTSDKKAVLICTVYPAGLEQMFREVSQAKPEEIIAIGERYGNTFH